MSIESYNGLRYEFERDAIQSISRLDRLSLTINSEKLTFIGSQSELIFLEEVLRHELDLRMNL